MVPSTLLRGFTTCGGALSFGLAFACGGLWSGGSREFDGPHAATIQGLAVSPDGAMLATASEDRTAKVWALPEMAGVRVLPHDDFVGAVAFSPDGARVATGGLDEVRIWSTASWEQVGTIPRPSFTVAWSATGIAVAPRDLSVVELYDGTTYAPVRTLTGHAEPVFALAYNGDGSLLVSGSRDRTARLWDVASGAEIKAFIAHKAGIVAIDLTADGTRLVTGSIDKTGRLWDVASAEPLRLLPGHTDWVTAVEFRAGDDVVVSAGRDGNVRLWDARTGATLAKMEVEEGAIEEARFATPDRVVAAGGQLHVREVGELLLDHTPGDPGGLRPLQPVCARLVACGTALARGGGEVGLQGVEWVRRAREFDVGDAAACGTELAAIGEAIGSSVPEPCVP